MPHARTLVFRFSLPLFAALVLSACARDAADRSTQEATTEKTTQKAADEAARSTAGNAAQGTADSAAQGTASDKAVQEPSLSPAQTKVVEEQIATLKYPEERQLASEWTNAKKMAEFMCHPLALETLEKQVPGTDRVFLGTDDPSTLTLHSDRLLAGSGSLRDGDDWKDFRFDCQLDPDTGKATAFQAMFDDTPGMRPDAPDAAPADTGQ